MALPEGAQENLKSVPPQSAIPLPKAASALFKISGLSSDLTAGPPIAGAVQKLATPWKGSRSAGTRRTQTEILLRPGCHAADIAITRAVRSLRTSWGSLPSSFTAKNLLKEINWPV